MKLARKLVALALVALASPAVLAATPKFDAITADDYGAIVKDISANFRYTTVSGASTLGKILGFEFGVVAGRTDIPQIYRIVKRTDPNLALDEYFYHGNLLARITVPYGLTLEAAAVPTITAGDVKFSQYGGGVLWTFSDILFDDSPVDVGVRGFYKTTKFTFSQTIQNTSTANIPVTANISLTDDLYGGQLVVSKRFLGMIEPYALVGYNKATGKLGLTSSVAAATIFASSFTTGSTAQASFNSDELRAGVDLQLAFISLGAEYARIFDTDSYTGRLSFRF